MSNLRIETAKERYQELFDDDAKIKAFDQLAEKYYCMNFGSASKTDLDILMFSLYIERILEKNQNDGEKYSDYTLSKLLGITQSKVSSLKVKKELLYPYEKFDWREAFKRYSENTVYENERIKLYIPDKNVYIEVKNAVELMGGFVEVQLTDKLLQIRPEYFVDLLIELSDSTDRNELRRKLKKEFERKNQDIQFMDKEFAKSLSGQGIEIISLLIDIASEFLPGPIGHVAKNVGKVISASSQMRINKRPRENG